MNSTVVERKRHIAKTLSYRAISTVTGFLITWTITRSIKISLTFSIVDFMYKLVQYYVHERIWYRYVKYGLKDIKKV